MSGRIWEEPGQVKKLQGIFTQSFYFCCKACGKTWQSEMILFVNIININREHFWKLGDCPKTHGTKKHFCLDTDIKDMLQKLTCLNVHPIMIKIANHKTGGWTQQKSAVISPLHTISTRNKRLKSNCVALPVTDNYSVMEFEWRQHWPEGSRRN